MRIQTMLLICLLSAALALGLAAAPRPVEARGEAAKSVTATLALQRSLGVECAHPSALRLLRFEDGSAQLRCGDQILVRVSVPG